ncbi:MAG: DUF4142 domain-containing protein [Verrucomicrobia bacterium]|nr:DUF4142 domain-containing protein [Verrucomicrobiota bacterium]
MPASSADAEFLAQIAPASLRQIELGRLASGKASNGEVQAYGQTMFGDQQRLWTELKATASTKGLAYPDALDEPSRTAVEELGQASGPDFDQRYLRQMVMEHQRMISLLDRYAAQGKDRGLQAWIARALPTFRRHLAMAETLLRSRS